LRMCMSFWAVSQLWSLRLVYILLSLTQTEFGYLKIERLGQTWTRFQETHHSVVQNSAAGSDTDFTSCI
jgi:hypothetical protein